MKKKRFKERENDNFVSYGEQKDIAKEMLSKDGVFRTPDSGPKMRHHRTNKRDWPRMLLHKMPVQYTGPTKKEMKKMLKKKAYG